MRYAALSDNENFSCRTKTITRTDAKSGDDLVFMSLSTLFKSYRDDKVVIMEIGRHCTAVKLTPSPVGLEPICRSSRSGPSCSKLTTSLVNDSLKFTSSDTQIF